MAKILLVEDDNNLREIYEARLQAEGYEIVSAKDGEEALVVAKKERPDLIIADVMMPRVSGFEMLDILRNTPELKAVHVIMLTALGQAEDKTRADSLGADRYLVKSQVTLEDIVKSAADVLAGAPATTPAMTAVATDGSQPLASSPAPASAAQPTVPPEITSVPVAAAPTPASEPPTPPPPVQDVSVPQAQPPIAPPSTTQPSDNTVPHTQIPSAPPVSQDTTQTAMPEPSAADSQLVADAVNNLVAGTAGVQPQPNPTPPSVPAQPSTPIPAPATPNPMPVAAPPPLTMQPVLTPPVAPTPPVPAMPPVPTDNSSLPPNQTTARKAITPLPPGSTPTQADLSELLAKEGHTMDDQGLSHMPGNVISPADSAAQTETSTPTPTDPNSISL